MYEDDDPPAPKFQRERVEIITQNLPLKSLIADIDSGEINLEPEYQRDFVWDTKKCMGLIKTVYEGLPVPALMLYRRHSAGIPERRDVVDGKQRLVTLYCYIKGSSAKFPRAPTSLKFDQKEDDLDALLDNKAFEQLTPEEQAWIRNYNIQVQTIPESTSLRCVFRIYETINAGGMEHSDQQLRRAAFYGRYIQLLNRLGQLTPGTVGETFAQLAELSPEEQSRHQAEELILRFFALRRAAIPSSKRPFRTPMRTFLNEELQTEGPAGRKVLWEPSDKDLNQMTQDFTGTVELLEALRLKEVAEEALKESGGKAKSFRKGSGGAVSVVWDITLVGLSLARDATPNPRVYERNAAALQQRYRALLGSPRWAGIPSILSNKNLMARLAAFREEVVEPALRGDPKA